MTTRKQYWLFKTEPSAFSIDDLAAAPKKTEHWDGVRNYQARNLLRDEIQKGDGVLFYHSQVSPPVVVGSCVVAKAGYPDHTAFDPKSKYFDPKSSPEQPRWFMVDVTLKKKFTRPVSLPELKQTPGLERMLVTQRGTRLSIQPVTAEEWRIVHELAGESP